MSSNFGEKIRKIRETEEYGRTPFSQLTDIKMATLTGVEQGRSQPRVELVEKVCQKFPQYAYWLMTGLTDPENGHISPEIELARRSLEKGAGTAQ